MSQASGGNAGSGRTRRMRDAILAGAQARRAGEPFDWPLADEGFDAAFASVADRIEKILGEDAAQFVTELRDAAGSMVLDDASTDPASTWAVDLHLCPVTGREEDVRALVADARRFGALAASFRESGLFHPRSVSLLVPTLLGPDVIAEAMPGAIRRATAILAEAVLSHALDDGSAVSLDDAANRAMAVLFGRHPPEATPPGRRPGTATRALVGVRILRIGDASDRDSLMHASDDEALAADVEAGEGWDDLVRSSGTVPEDLVVGRPDRWTDGASRAASDRIAFDLAAEAARTGVSAEAAEPDVLLFHIGAESIHVSIGHGGGTTGPAAVPTALAVVDFDAFMTDLSSICGRIVEHSDISGLISGPIH